MWNTSYTSRYGPVEFYEYGNELSGYIKHKSQLSIREVNQSRYRPGVAQRVPGRFADFMTTAQKGGKVVSLTHRPHLPPGNPPGTHLPG